MKKVALQPIGESALVTTGTALLSALLSKDLKVRMSCNARGVCSTCHVHIREGMDQLSPIESRERRTLSLIADCRPDSRLACQTRVYGDGIVVSVPEGMYIERVEDLLALLGDPAPQNILHPITGQVLIGKGKLITRTLLEQSRSLERELRALNAGGDSSVASSHGLSHASSRFLASGSGYRPPTSTPTTPIPFRAPPPRTAPAPVYSTRPPLLPPSGPVGDLPSTAASVSPVGSTSSGARVGRPAALQAGVQVDKYLLVECVGKGGAGVVFRALHTKLKTPVAVKFLRADVMSSDPQALERFTHEAQLLAQLVHPNVVRVLDFEDSPLQPYVVMEYVDGASAADLIKQSGRLAPERAVEVVLDATEGLAAAHALGIVHRDIKPGNILVTRAGTSKLVDLGLAMIARPGTERGGAVVGTVGYMSPEQVEGDPEVDHRSDIYSLGATLYHLITGRLPFTGQTSRQVVLKHLHQPVTPPHEVVPGLPVDLSRVVVAMMGKRPLDRPQHCGEVRDDLAAVLAKLRAGVGV